MQVRESGLSSVLPSSLRDFGLTANQGRMAMLIPKVEHGGLKIQGSFTELEGFLPGINTIWDKSFRTLIQSSFHLLVGRLPNKYCQMGRTL